MFDFSQFTFRLKDFRLGMRTVKTGIAVFLTILLFQLMDWEGANIAALTAVFSLREDFDRSLHIGASRILGNTIGGSFAILYFLLYGWIDHPFLVKLFFIPFFVMLTIMVNVAMNNKPGVIGSVAAFLIITLTIPQGDSLIYAFQRVLETFAGVFIAIFVNYDLNRLQEKWGRKTKK